MPWSLGAGIVMPPVTGTFKILCPIEWTISHMAPEDTQLVNISLSKSLRIALHVDLMLLLSASLSSVVKLNATPCYALQCCTGTSLLSLWLFDVLPSHSSRFLFVQASWGWPSSRQRCDWTVFHTNVSVCSFRSFDFFPFSSYSCLRPWMQVLACDWTQQVGGRGVLCLIWAHRQTVPMHVSWKPWRPNVQWAHGEVDADTPPCFHLRPRAHFQAYGFHSTEHNWVDLCTVLCSYATCICALLIF